MCLPKRKAMAGLGDLFCIGGAAAVFTSDGGVVSTGGQRTDRLSVSSAGETETLSYVAPDAQTVAVPAEVNPASVRVVGGHGGTTFGNVGDAESVDGAQISGVLPAHAGEVLTVRVHV